MKLTKKQVLNDFKELYLNDFKKSNPIEYKALRRDTEMLKQLWQDFCDALNKDGLLTANQVINWSNPF
jgi:hypothetical protein